MRDILFILIGLLLSACGQSRSDSHYPEPVMIGRIDLYISDSIGSADSLQPGLDLYLAVMGLDSMGRDEAVGRLYDSDVIRIFGADIKARFTAADSLQSPLGDALHRVAGILPDIRVGRIYGIASPYMQSVIVSDSTVFIALNHYLGADYPGYESMPSYVARHKVPARVVPDVVEALVRVSYPYEPVEGTVLERMLYEGAVARAVSLALDDDMQALGYTPAQFEDAYRHECDIWKALAAGRMLYSNSPSDIALLFGPAPFSRLGSLELPSRIGRYVGLAIVDSYVDNNPDVPLSRLLSQCFYGESQQSLIKSRYTPG